jgi:hypothetical protein
VQVGVAVKGVVVNPASTDDDVGEIATEVRVGTAVTVMGTGFPSFVTPPSVAFTNSVVVLAASPAVNRTTFPEVELTLPAALFVSDQE